jgi:ADP-ribose pyrophosphatase YjhB (NUDIX family)
MNDSATPRERFRLTAEVHLLLVVDGRILLLKRANTGYEDGNYGLVAGHVDGGEPLSGAMAREAREESGLSIDPRDLTMVHVMHRRDGEERMSFFFTASAWQGEPCNMEPDKCDELRWFSIDALPENTVPYIRDAIADFRRGILYSERGWS